MAESSLLEKEQAIAELLIELGKLKKTSEQLKDAEKRSKEIIDIAENIARGSDGILKNNSALRDEIVKTTKEAQLVISSVKADMLTGQSDIKSVVTRLVTENIQLSTLFEKLQEVIQKESDQFASAMKLIEVKLEVYELKLAQIEKKELAQEEQIKTNHADNVSKINTVMDMNRSIREFMIGVLILSFIMLGLLTVALFMIYFRTQS